MSHFLHGSFICLAQNEKKLKFTETTVCTFLHLLHFVDYFFFLFLNTLETHTQITNTPFIIIIIE